jgi:Fic family protein
MAEYNGIRMTQSLYEALQMRERGMTVAAIAKTKGVSTDTVRRSIREYDDEVARRAKKRK